MKSTDFACWAALRFWGRSDWLACVCRGVGCQRFVDASAPSFLRVIGLCSALLVPFVWFGDQGRAGPLDELRSVFSLVSSGRVSEGSVLTILQVFVRTYRVGLGFSLWDVFVTDSVCFRSIENFLFFSMRSLCLPRSLATPPVLSDSSAPVVPAPRVLFSSVRSVGCTPCFLI